MKFKPFQTATVVIGISAGILPVDLVSQSVPESTTALLLRKQFQEIADDVVAKFTIVPPNNVVVSVESPYPVTSVQNAFLDALQRKGCQPFLHANGDSVSAALTVTVLHEKVTFEDFGGKNFLRTVESEVEARIEFGSFKSAQYLGTFRRSARDTVQEREPEYVKTPLGSLHEEDASTFQRLVGPLIVLASSVLVVYLFFTVRS